MAALSDSRSSGVRLACALKSKKYFLRRTQQRMATSVDVVSPLIRACASEF